MQITVNTDLANIKRAMAGDQRKMKRVLRIAINKTIDKARTTGKDSLKDEANKNAKKKIDMKLLNKKLKVTRANYGRLTASIKLGRIRRYADQYTHEITDSGIVFHMPEGTYYKAGAFRARMSNGKRGAFIRKTARRRGDEPTRRIKSGKNKGQRYRPQLPIKRITATAVSKRMLSRKVIQDIDARVRREYPKELLGAINYVLTGRFNG